MKEATGELNMTVVTLVAVAAIGAVFYFVVWPLIQRTLVTQSCRTAYGSEYVAVRGAEQDNSGQTQARTYHWTCCPKGTTSGDTCFDYDSAN